MEDVLKGRMGMYTFFTSVLIDVPPKELLRDLYEGKVEFPKLEGVEIVLKYPKEFKSFEEFERAVRQEYTAVFVNPFDEHVSLYQSEYENDYPYGKVTLRVLEMFKRLGYRCVYTEPADHIGVYMAVMAKSCEEALKGNYEELKKQKEIMKELEKWVFRLCDEIEKHREAKFYKGIAKMLRDFIKVDRDLINELILYASRNQ